MQVSDIVSLEEEWVYHNQIPWMDRYPLRLHGVSSNEYCTGCVSESNAAEKTAEAWSAAIGYHFATDKSSTSLRGSTAMLRKCNRKKLRGHKGDGRILCRLAQKHRQ